MDLLILLRYLNGLVQTTFGKDGQYNIQAQQSFLQTEPLALNKLIKVKWEIVTTLHH